MTKLHIPYNAILLIYITHYSADINSFSRFLRVFLDLLLSRELGRKRVKSL